MSRRPRATRARPRPRGRRLLPPPPAPQAKTQPLTAVKTLKAVSPPAPMAKAKTGMGSQAGKGSQSKLGGKGQVTAAGKQLTKQKTGSYLLRNVDLDEDSGVPYSDQLRKHLQKNAVRVIDLFREWDADGSGSVSKKEFCDNMKLLGLNVPKKDVVELFESMDPSGDGQLEYNELNKLLRGGDDRVKLDPKLKAGAMGAIQKKPAGGSKKKMDKQTSSLLRNIDLDEDSGVPVSVQLRGHLQKNAVRVIDLFREWDADGSGSVSKKEFADNMKLLGLQVAKKDINELFDSMDPDGSGSLEYQELSKLLRGGDERVKLDAKLKPGAMGKIDTKAQNKSTKNMAAAAPTYDDDFGGGGDYGDDADFADYGDDFEDDSPR